MPLQELSMPERAERHERAAARKAAEIDARRALGETYLREHPDGIVVPPERAVAVVDLAEETRAAREEAMAHAERGVSRFDNGALQFPVLAEELPADGAVIALGTSPLLLAPIVRYLGMLPILFNLFVTRAHQTELRPDTAHRFHLDPEDIRSFKVLVHLTDVDEGCGPFHALPADRTDEVIAAVGYRGIEYLDDERVAELVGWDAVVQATGPAGTAALADTTRCLHFGGRPRAEGKPVRDMLVYQYLLPTSFLLSTSSGRVPQHFLPQLPATGDDHWDALIGRRFT